MENTINTQNSFWAGATGAGRKRLTALVLILAAIAVIAIIITLTLLYNAAFEQQRIRLLDLVNSQAGLIKAVARYDQSNQLNENPDYDPVQATLSQIRDALKNHEGLGKTGEIIIAKCEDDNLELLFSLRHDSSHILNNLPDKTGSACAIRESLQGKSGTIVTKDYRGVKVMAAYKPVEELDLGLVAKINIAEIKEPYVRTGLISGGMAILLVLFGSILFYHVGNPMVNELMEKEARLVDLTTSMPGCAYQFMLTRDGNIYMPYVSDSMSDLIGIGGEILMQDATKLYDYIHPDDHEMFNDSVQESAANKSPWELEFRVIATSGKIIWLNGRSIPRQLPDGSLLWNGLLIDVTDRKRAEYDLVESERKFRSYVDNSPDGMFISNKNRDIIDVNASASKITGYSREELLSMKIEDLYEKNMLSAVQDSISTVRTTGRSRGEVEFRRRDGSTGFWLVNVVRLDDDQYLSFVKDITEMKLLRDLKSRAERLEMAGTVAGQVAHDFNNLLAPIVAYPEFIRDGCDDDPEIKMYLDSMEKAAQKIAEINQDLLTLGRRGHYNLDVLNINTIVRQAISEMNAECKNISFEIDLGENILNIMGGSAQIHRMISNLLHNARDAISDEGRITVKTENYYVDDDEILYNKVRRGEYVKLTISDNGCGIHADILQNIFDPFFTTKNTDKRRGTGLGMSVVDAVVKDHNAIIDLRSEVGRGTSFYIYFPITRKLHDHHAQDEIAGGGESVLIVDDDDVQREVSYHILSKLGYRVQVLDKGEKAVEFMKTNSCDLVILDMIMPGGIDGAETYRRILEIRPNQKAIVLSGFSETDRVSEIIALGAGAFVQKPLTRNELALAVRTELDRQLHTEAVI